MDNKLDAWINKHKYVIALTIVAATCVIRLHNVNKTIVIFSQDLQRL